MPPEISIAFVHGAWEELVTALGSPDESAAVLLAGVAEDDRRLTFLVNQVIWVPDEHYRLREPLRLDIASGGWMPALKRAARLGLHPIFFHTHPGGDPEPSELDDGVDAALADAFTVRSGVSRYASVILGGTIDQPQFSGRAVADGRDLAPIRRARIVGRRIQLLTAYGETKEADHLLHDRQVRAFGDAGQAMLERLRIGVVGAGGTGSSVIEQLTRLGVGTIIAVDDDVITETNVSRVYGSALSDVDAPKVTVAAQNAARIGLGTELIAIDDTIRRRAPLEALRTCDIVFGCTDDHTGRLNLSRLAFYYLIPVIDLGVMIDSDGAVVRSITGRITYVAPGEPCLRCRGTIDPNLLREEGLPRAEREALAGEGYARGLNERDPSVIAYTTMVAAWGIADMLERLIGFGAPDIRGELRLRIADRKTTQRSDEAQPDHFCGTSAIWGTGDQPDFLGQRIWL